uniref:Uncharacterized protein n=1 Tax=Anguilla anguilla TaxID=7936 RepID=A0A0E9W6V9_ANGAN
MYLVLRISAIGSEGNANGPAAETGTVSQMTKLLNNMKRNKKI